MNVIHCLLFTCEPVDLFGSTEVDVCFWMRQFRLCHPAATNTALSYLIFFCISIFFQRQYNMIYIFQHAFWALDRNPYTA